MELLSSLVGRTFPLITFFNLHLAESEVKVMAALFSILLVSNVTKQQEPEDWDPSLSEDEIKIRVKHRDERQNEATRRKIEENFMYSGFILSLTSVMSINTFALRPEWNGKRHILTRDFIFDII